MPFHVDPSGTVEVFNAAKRLEERGVHLFHLEVGELDVPTPEYVVDAAVEGLRAGHTRYGPTRGNGDLRRQVVEKERARYGLDWLDPDANVLVTPGAKFGLFLGLLALLEKGDEVVVFSPSYPSYRSVPKALETKIREVSILRGARTVPTDEIFEDFRSKVNEATRVVIMNGPCNPTGQVIGPKLVGLLWELAQEFPRLWFLADDVYEQFIYPPATFNSVARHDADLSRTILVNGLSKSFCMTGFRVGWVVANSEVVTALERIQQNSVTCVPPFVQDAAEVALRSMNEGWPEYLAFRRALMEDLLTRRALTLERLEGIDGVTCNENEGAFYAFPDVTGVTPDDELFCLELLKRGVALTPGSAFGAGGSGHVRVAFTRPVEEIARAMDVLEEFCAEKKQGS
ncbi:MAG: pyridoxal phosphate-dependent aminotransferase [Promethearchaeota archaeon]